MGVCESEVPGWVELDWDDPQSGHKEVWDRFYDQFLFRPSVEPSDWPGIVEPTRSMTFSISHVYDPAKYERHNEQLSAWAIEILRERAGDAWVYALNWHHCCYRLFPGTRFSVSDPDEWPVPILPNGDYYIFLAPDLSYGFFGHPWERTMCFWGAALLPRLEANVPSALYGPIRSGGVRTSLPWVAPVRP